MSIGERLDGLSRGELAGLVVVLVATLGGAGLWYIRSLPKPIQVAETSTSTRRTDGVGFRAGASPARHRR